MYVLKSYLFKYIAHLSYCSTLYAVKFISGFLTQGKENMLYMK